MNNTPGLGIIGKVDLEPKVYAMILCFLGLHRYYQIEVSNHPGRYIRCCRTYGCNHRHPDDI